MQIKCRFRTNSSLKKETKVQESKRGYEEKARGVKEKKEVIDKIREKGKYGKAMSLLGRNIGYKCNVKSDSDRQSMSHHPSRARSMLGKKKKKKKGKHSRIKA